MEAESKILHEEDLAERFKVARRTVRRMKDRGEVPRPFTMNGRSCWLEEHLNQHIKQRAEQAVKEGEKQRAKIQRLSP